MESGFGFDVGAAPTTPALVVSAPRLERNIARMAEASRAGGFALRPHAKTHKCVQIAERQLAAGAVGLTVATIGEAEAFADAGVSDLFIAYPLWLRSVSRLTRSRAANSRSGGSGSPGRIAPSLTERRIRSTVSSNALPVRTAWNA